MLLRRRWLCLVVFLMVAVLVPIPANADPDVPPAAEVVHVVAPGDTLWSIAVHYGVSVDSVQQANGITDPARIFVGQRLSISGSAVGGQSAGGPQVDQDSFTAVHVVAGGETLNGIAARYGTTGAVLAQANGISNPNRLTVGQRLAVPGDGDNAVHVGGDATGLPWPFAGFEMASPQPAQGDTVLVRVDTSEDAMVSGSFEGQTIVFSDRETAHWGLLPIHPMAALGPYEVWIKATVPDREPVSIVGQLRVVDGDFEVEDITLPADKNRLLDADLIAAERQKLGGALDITEPVPLWHGLFTYPVPEPVISSEFGTRRGYNGGPATGYHEGLDFDAEAGDPVRAVADGHVVLAEPLTVRGNAILLDHGMGVHTGYWHLSEIDVVSGQDVKAGDVIGRVGSSGLSTGPHLHWEIRIGQINVNPKQWTRQVFP